MPAVTVKASWSPLRSSGAVIGLDGSTTRIRAAPRSVRSTAFTW
ncbi:MAG: hypothetical protein ACYCU7_17865 [Acidimicrobiales bacterium]